MEQEGSSEQEGEAALRQQLENVVLGAKEYFRFQAPHDIEVKMVQGHPLALVRSQPSNPYDPKEKPFDVLVSVPTTLEGREKMIRMVPFLMRHELAHAVPLPAELEFADLPKEDIEYFNKTNFWPEFVSSGRNEIIVDVLALRSGLGLDGRLDPAVVDAYLETLQELDEPYGPKEQIQPRDILRGLVLSENLAERGVFSLDQLRWLESWRRRAEERMQSRLTPEDAPAVGRARELFHQSMQAAWEMDLRPPE